MTREISVRDLGRPRRRRYDEQGPNRATVALFVGAIVLLLASAGLIAAMLRQGSGTQAASPTPGGTAVVAVATPRPTDIPATNTTPPPTTVAATATGTARPATATTTARPATPTVAATSRPGSPTPRPATVQAGGCAVALPAGFSEERPGGGYFPANDDTGFIALDPFETDGGQRSTEELAQAFIEKTLRVVLRDFQQTAAIHADGQSRIEYTARAGEKTGRGVVVVRPVGNIACGVTLFALNDSPIAFDQTLNYLLSSLQPARP